MDPPGSYDYHAVYALKNIKINEAKIIRIERNREILNCSWELQNALKESEITTSQIISKGLNQWARVVFCVLAQNGHYAAYLFIR